jgi:sugar (pentulose or hexulose) kinase
MAGASSCLNSVVPSPLADLQVTHYSYVVPDRFCTEVGVNTTGAAISWAMGALGYPSLEALTSDADRFRRRLQRSARDSTGTAADAAPLFLPYLGDGERDDPTARGSFVGLSGRHERPALAFAVIEGVALAVRSVLLVLEQAGSPLRELRVGGGGARIGLAGQLKADLLGRAVLHLDVDPAGLGAAALGASAVDLAADAAAAISATLRRARRYTPSRWGASFEQDRAAWFDQVRAAAVLHSHREGS